MAMLASVVMWPNLGNGSGVGHGSQSVLVVTSGVTSTDGGEDISQLGICLWSPYLGPVPGSLLGTCPRWLFKPLNLHFSWINLYLFDY